MDLVHIKKNQLETSHWSGGKTHQYYIFPEIAQYSERDFIFRISSATLDIAPSTFTQFDGYDRYLLMIDNQLTIKINDQDHAILQDEIIQFNSCDECIAYTTGSVFNLMVNDKVKYHSLLHIPTSVDLDALHCIIFVIHPNTIQINHVDYHLEPLDCIVINNPNKEKIALTLQNECLVGIIDY